jgi:hypothetical protein
MSKGIFFINTILIICFILFLIPKANSEITIIQNLKNEAKFTYNYTEFLNIVIQIVIFVVIGIGLVIILIAYVLEERIKKLEKRIKKLEDYIKTSIKEK